MNGGRLPTTPDFDELYRHDDDPWRTETSWYERRKLSVLLAALPRERYRRIWEPGCGPGITSRALAGRTVELFATDASATALRHAKRRCRGLPGVQFEQLELPALPAFAPVDLVVVAEFLYYVADLDSSLMGLWSALDRQGQIAFVHWRHHPHDAFRSGDAMHDQIRTDAAARQASLLATHEEPDFRIEVFQS